MRLKALTEIYTMHSFNEVQSEMLVQFHIAIALSGVRTAGSRPGAYVVEGRARIGRLRVRVHGLSHGAEGTRPELGGRALKIKKILVYNFCRFDFSSSSNLTSRLVTI